MLSVGVFDAKTNLSKYITKLTEKQEDLIIIEKNGKPVAKLTPYHNQTSSRIGIAKDVLPKMPDLDEFNSVDTGDFSGNGELL